ncbi:Rv3235 family protein [Streptomyces sp. NPDC002004]
MHKVMTRRTTGRPARTAAAPPGGPGRSSRPPGRRETRRPTGGRPTERRLPARRVGGGTGPGADRVGGASPGAGHVGGTGSDAGRPRTVPAAPPPRPTDVFADRLLAVLSGMRPVHWMLRHTAGGAYDELARLAERSPLRTRGVRPVVRDVGYYVPRADAIEAFARIAAGGRLRAMAFRLERGADRRWRCTAVELGG